MAALIQTAFEALFKKAKRAASLPREKANSAASLPALPPMKRSDFLKIKAQFEKRGGHILQGPQASLILDSQSANGATSLDGKTIFLRDNPAASTVYEELAHSRQLSSGRFDGTLECLLALEVEAKALILWRSKSLGLSDAEVEYVKSLMAEDVKSLAAEKDCKKAG